MKGTSGASVSIAVIAVVLLSLTVAGAAQQGKPQEMPRISPEDLAAVLRGSGAKPLVLQVGVARLFRYAHIRGSEYAGPASEPEGIEMLRKRVQALPRTASIVIYCGCCPWEHCPNVKPAYDELRKMGFRNVKALYLPNNFKFDWDDKGYPTAKGE
jgi:thiosulfate/3-mercaptopyruvate sulfurtransferase